MRHFQVLIVSAVKLCKRCLQTGSASRRLPQARYRGFAPRSHCQTTWAVAPKENLLRRHCIETFERLANLNFLRFSVFELQVQTCTSTDTAYMRHDRVVNRIDSKSDYFGGIVQLYRLDPTGLSSGRMHGCPTTTTRRPIYISMPFISTPSNTR